MRSVLFAIVLGLGGSALAATSTPSTTGSKPMRIQLFGQTWCLGAGAPTAERCDVRLPNQTAQVGKSDDFLHDLMGRLRAAAANGTANATHKTASASSTHRQ